MSVRAVWVLSCGGKEKCRLLFTRKFPTVEKRVQSGEKERYIPVPEARDFLETITEELALKYPTHEFVESRDGCSKKNQKPVFELQTVAGPLWPLLIVEQNDLLYCCLPYIEPGKTSRPPLNKCPGISAGFTLLLSMADFLGHVPRNVSETNMKFAQLHQFLSEAAPFGTPVEVNPHNIQLYMTGKIPPVAGSSTQKIPAWRPVPHKGKSSLFITIKEHIQAVQYDNQKIPDVWEVYGSVICRSEVEGSLPEVMVTLEYAADRPSTMLDHLTVHPCVNSADAQTSDHRDARPSPNKKVPSRKLCFTPLAETFTLCHYSARTVPNLPIQGFYQMKGQTEVDLLVQLRLRDNIINSFEYCEMQLPFSYRGPIVGVDSTPSHGNLLVAQDKKVLVWNLGRKFPKIREVFLKATVRFSSYNSGSADAAHNAYGQLLFKIPNYTHTGLQVDTKSVQVNPPTKCKISAGQEYSSVDYKIWNSHGDVPTAFHPPEDLFAA